MSDKITNRFRELNDEVSRIFQSGDIRTALRLSEDVHTKASKELQQDNPEFVKSIFNLGLAYALTNRNPEAESKYEQALEILRNQHEETNPIFYKILVSLAGIYASTNRYAQAEALYLQSIDKLKITRGTDDIEYAVALNQQASLYRDSGVYEKAENLFKESIEIFDKSDSVKDIRFSRAYNNFGIHYWNLRNLRESEKLFNQSIAVFEQTGGQSHPDCAKTMMNLANVHMEKGNYAGAEKLYSRALEVFEKSLGKSHSLYAMCLGNLAVLYYRLGNNSHSERLYQEACDLLHDSFGENNPIYAKTLSNYALLCIEIGKLDQAETLILKTIDIRKKTLGEKHPEYAISLLNLSTLYKKRGDYCHAIELAEQSIRILKAALGDNHILVMKAGIDLGTFYYDFGEFDRAENLFKTCTKIADLLLGETNPEFVSLNVQLSQVYASQNQLDNAIRHIDIANRIRNQIIAHVFSFTSENRKIDYIRSVKHEIDYYLSLLKDHFMDNPAIVNSAYNLVLQRKAISAEALALQRDTIYGKNHPEFKDRLDELKTIRTQIAMKTLRGPGPEGKDVHEDFLKKWTDQKNKIESEIARMIPEFELEENLQKADWKAVASALPEKSVLIEYIRFRYYDFKAIPANGEQRWKDEYYLAFVLSFNEPEKVKVIGLGKAEHIDSLIGKFRSSMQQSDDSAQRSGLKSNESTHLDDTNIYGQKIYSDIFLKLGIKPEKYHSLLISPDGNLNNIAFGILPVDDKSLLIDQYLISYIPVGKDILRFGVKHSLPSGIFFIAADPDFDFGSHASANIPSEISENTFRSPDLKNANLRFARLPGTKLESLRVASLLDTTAFTGDQVLDADIKSLKSPQIMHLATHGFFLENTIHSSEQDSSEIWNPLLQSGLALTGANTFINNGTLPTEAEDGILTAEDVSGLDLTGTEMVVLSACDTGLGQIQTSEGVFGFRRSFVLAGAKTLVMSLWKIPDLATPILMELFYDNIVNRGMHKAEALRDAQLRLRGMKLKELRSNWLSEEIIASFAEGNEIMRERFQSLALLPDDFKPFDNPVFWGAFICQGDPGPLTIAPFKIEN